MSKDNIRVTICPTKQILSLKLRVLFTGTNRSGFKNAHSIKILSYLLLEEINSMIRFLNGNED